MIMQTVIAPIVGGLVVRRFLPGGANRIERPIGAIAGLALTRRFCVGRGQHPYPSEADARRNTPRHGDLCSNRAGRRVPDGNAQSRTSGCARPGERFATSRDRSLALATASYPDEQFGGIVLLFLVVNALVSVPFMKEMSAGRPSQIRMTA